MELTNGENAFKKSTEAQLKRMKSKTTFRPLSKPVVTNDEKFKSHDSLLFISQIHASVQEHKLRNLFSPYAEVLGLRLISKENNRKFCFMNVRDQKQAEKIISTFDGYSLNGQNIHISYSREKKTVPAANVNQDDLNEPPRPSKFYQNEHALSHKVSKFYENNESPFSPKVSKFYKSEESPPSPKVSKFYKSEESPPSPKASNFYKSEESSSSPKASKFYKSEESPPYPKASKFYKGDPPQPAWISEASRFYLDDSRVSPPNLSKFHIDDPKSSELLEKEDVPTPVDLGGVSVNIANSQFGPQNNMGSNLSSDVNCGTGVLNFQNLEKPIYYDIDFDRNYVVTPLKEDEPVVTTPETEEPENNVLYFENIEYEDNSVDFDMHNRDCGNFSIVSDAKNELFYEDSTKVVDTQDKLFYEDPNKLEDTQNTLFYGDCAKVVDTQDGNSENAKDPCTEFSETCGVLNFYNCESEESFSSNGSFRYRPVDFDLEFDDNISPTFIDSLHQRNNVEDADFGYNFRQTPYENGCGPFQYTFNDADFLNEDDILNFGDLNSPNDDDAPNFGDLNFLNEDDIPNRDDLDCA